MVTGRILQFDHVRGYGFVGADDDGEDVFLHASVFDGDTDQLAPGTKVEFKVMAGDRGRKAFAAYRVEEEPEKNVVPPPRAVPPQPAALSRPVPGPHPGPVSTPVPPAAPAPPSPSAETRTAPASQPGPHSPGKDLSADDEQMCDVLSPAEFGQEMTELLLSSVSSLTAQQVLAVRQSVLDFAKKLGWVNV